MCERLNCIRKDAVRRRPQAGASARDSVAAAEAQAESLTEQESEEAPGRPRRGAREKRCRGEDGDQAFPGGAQTGGKKGRTGVEHPGARTSKAVMKTQDDSEGTLSTRVRVCRPRLAGRATRLSAEDSEGETSGSAASVPTDSSTPSRLGNRATRARAEQGPPPGRSAPKPGRRRRPGGGAAAAGVGRTV